MKRKTIPAIATIALALLTLGACQKEGPKGDTGAQGPAGPDAKTFNYTVNFSAGETYRYYDGIVGSFDAGDVIVTYIEDPNEDDLPGLWVQVPYISNDGVSFYPEITETGGVYINTVVAGESYSPWTGPHYFNCRSVLIKSSGLIKHPGVDLSNYEEVKEAFDL